MPLKQLHKGDEDRRQWSVIEASQSGDSRYIPQLLARLHSDETFDNKRHIVRALGNVGDKSVVPHLLALLDQPAKGNLLGDVARSLGQLDAREAIQRLKALRNHRNTWVRQNAMWALKKMNIVSS